MLRQLINTKAQLEQKQKELYASIEPELNEINEHLIKINEQIANTIAPIANVNRTALSKETGTIDFILDGVKVKHDVPKRVKWDQKQLSGIRARIIAGNADPDEYMTTEYKVKESSYKAWPSFIKEIFTPARTVEYGAPKVTFEIVETTQAEAPTTPWQPRAIDGGRR